MHCELFNFGGELKFFEFFGKPFTAIVAGQLVIDISLRAAFEIGA